MQGRDRELVEWPTEIGQTRIEIYVATGIAAVAILTFQPELLGRIDVGTLGRGAETAGEASSKPPDCSSICEK